MRLVTLLCYNQNTQNAMRKVMQAIYPENSFSIPDFLQTPPGIDKKEFLVSEAMKLACNKDQPVIIVGLDKEDTIEKDIHCNRFKSLIKFFPFPVSLADIITFRMFFNNLEGLVCEEKCTAFGVRCNPRSNFGNIYAGEIIRRLGHELDKKDLQKFLSSTPYVSTLRDLFIPQHKGESSLVNSYIEEMKKLEKIAKNSKDKFRKALISTLENKLFKDFPYFWGGE